MALARCGYARRVTRDQLADWLRRYEAAWRAPGTDSLARLFTTDASYRTDPFEEPCSGLQAIEEMWEAERDGPDEQFEMRWEIVAVEGDTGVVRLEVDYGVPLEQRFRDLWVVVLHQDGLCSSFEEWPFWPLEPRGEWPCENG